MKVIAKNFGWSILMVLGLKILSIFGTWVYLSPKTLLFSAAAYFVVGLTAHKILKDSAGDEYENEDARAFINHFSSFIGLIPFLFLAGTSLSWDKEFLCQNYYVADMVLGEYHKNIQAYNTGGERIGTWTQTIIDAEKAECFQDPHSYFSTADFVMNPVLLFLAWACLALTCWVLVKVRNEKEAFDGGAISQTSGEATRKAGSGKNFEEYDWLSVDRVKDMSVDIWLPRFERELQEEDLVARGRAHILVLGTFNNDMLKECGIPELNRVLAILNKVKLMLPDFYSDEEKADGKLEKRLSALTNKVALIERKIQKKVV